MGRYVTATPLIWDYGCDECALRAQKYTHRQHGPCLECDTVFLNQGVRLYYAPVEPIQVDGNWPVFIPELEQDMRLM